MGQRLAPRKHICQGKVETETPEFPGGCFFCSPFPRRVFRRFPCRWERSEAAARIDPLRFSMLRDIYTLHSSIIYIYTYTYVKSVDSIFITTCKCSIHDSFDMTFRLIN